MTSTLHHLTPEILQFLEQHRFQVSTSIDGPEAVHNANRPTKDRNAYARTVEGVALARSALGPGSVSALTTLTRASLEQPEAIVDEYVNLGFSSIFLRPLSPYGFAQRANRKIGYSAQEFVRFYDASLAYILLLNRSGIEIAEAYAGILLSHILTPFPSPYVDLRSPAGAGANVLVYNYDGSVYASDEGRMLAEMGDRTFRLGDVRDTYAALMTSPAMSYLRSRNLAETLTPCATCAFVPFCGADPVQAHATRAASDRPAEGHCARHLGLFQILFRYLAEGDADVLRIFDAWSLRMSPSTMQHGTA